MSDFNVCLECNKDKQDYFGCWTCRDYGIKLAEKERIIKLLEAFINDCTQEKLCRNCIGVNWAIAEIKGNNEN